MKEKHPQQTPVTAVSDLPQPVVNQLGTLRENIDAIDRQIIALLAKRRQEVDAICTLKKSHNLAVCHPGREEDIVSDRRARGAEAGLDPDYVEELFRCIMHRSRAEQADRIARKGTFPGARVLIVGGSGGMGQYFLSYFSNAGYEVRSMRSTDWPKVDTFCRDINLAIISVPIDVTVSVIGKIAPHLPPTCVLTDLTSTKRQPMDAMLTTHPGPVVGLHPLFGPTTSSMDRQIVAVTEGRDPAACQWVMDQLRLWGAVMVRTDPDEHDEIMAIVQCLRHFATFAFGRFLCQRQLDLTRSLAFSSPIYRLELAMVGRLFAQDASLYSEIIFASPERIALLKSYLASLAENLEMLERMDKKAFKDQFAKIAEWFGPFSKQAMQESTFLIDKLIERF